MADPTAPIPGAGRARTTRRRGRLSPALRLALVELAPRWGLPGPEAWTPEGLRAAFGREAPRLLDIGVGNGRASRAWARSHPDWDVVAAELHRPGVARLLLDLEAEGPPNVRVAEADVTLLLADGLEPGTFHAVRVLFPDPWPKRRHVERRLVDRAFLAQVATLLPPGGMLHLATDWDDYATQVRELAAGEHRLVPSADGAPSAEGGWTSERPDRPVTTYEQRGLTAGRTVTDLVFHRR